ncbi:Cytoplasmic tRNA 2-thiolation protein 2 [Smittium mucronatum]|uniref:Cytoplasmic tRNA 2-thiolation protein 2 n=1 Tax=Smittium mucronatum TaxID=133383 RepID=A0A1R0GRQ4_9FUNG|nr:Cytoplasmic tRNA 2-thiolation protein 2 [Smittium mucronatum]
MDTLPSINKNICDKCKVNKSTILIRQAKFCTNCFKINYTNKFKSNLSKSSSPVIDARADIMAAISGGANSISLLDLISDFQIPKTSSHQKYNSLSIGHIDESTLFPSSDENSIMNIIKKYPFKSVTRKLEEVFESNKYNTFFKTHKRTGNDVTFSKAETEDLKSPSELLLSFFESITSPSTKDYMLTQIKNFLILDMAKELKCQVVATGDTSTSIANKTILNIVEGRGYSLPFDIGAESSQDPEVWILRPLRTSTKKEVAFYNHVSGLESCVVPSFSTKASGSDNSLISLGHLTETFLSGLDSEFPATVSTVASTVSKIKINDEIKESDPSCLLCFSKISKHASRYKNEVSVGFRDDSESIQNHADLTSIQTQLCYACLANVENLVPNTVLPGFVSQTSTST